MDCFLDAHVLVEITQYLNPCVQGNHNLSTHEKELLDLKSKIEQMEKSNLEPKTWTMQGEVMFCLLFI